MKGTIIRVLAAPAFLLIVLGVWQVGVTWSGIPKYLLPTPLEIVKAARLHWSMVQGATLLTGSASLLGLLSSFALSQVIAVAFTQSPLLRLSCYPYAILLQTVPIVAIAPPVILWSGYGFHSVVLVSAIISLFPMITATTNGLLSVDRELLELFELHKARWYQVLLRLRYPSATRYIITGLKTSCGLAVVGAIVGEYFMGSGSLQPGLGYYIFVDSQNAKTDRLFVSVLASTSLGVAYFGMVNLLAVTLLRRYYDPTSLRTTTR